MSSNINNVNSQGVTKENDKTKRKHLTLQEHMEKFYGKPFNEIDVYFETTELDWGEPVGEEVW